MVPSLATYKQASLYTLESSFHYMRGFLPLTFVRWGAICPNFYGNLVYPQGYAAAKFGGAPTNSFRDIHTLHIFPISNQSIHF